MEIASTSVTARQCTSPVKPDNDATEPKEKAKCAQTHLFSTPGICLLNYQGQKGFFAFSILR